MDKAKSFLMNKILSSYKRAFLCSTVLLVLLCLILSSSLSSYKSAAIPLIVLRALMAISAFVYACLKKGLATSIICSMIIGVEVGLDIPTVAIALSFLSSMFLRMVKTIIAPILFSTLVVGIAGHSNAKEVGIMGLKSLIYFEIITTLALFIGLGAINLTKAGSGISNLGILEDETTNLPSTTPLTWQQMLLHFVPENIVKSVYDGDILSIVTFSITFGASIVLLPCDKTKFIFNTIDNMSIVMFKFTKIIMYFAPIGVFSAISQTLAKMGASVLVSLIKLLLTLYASLFIFIIVVLLPILVFYAKVPLRKFFKAVGSPALVALTTTSSESALPLLMDNLVNKLGLSSKVVSFVLPMGYSFNLDGSTLYLTLATIFVAQAANIELSIGNQLFILLSLVLTSKGIAGVPRATLVILLGTCRNYNIPEWPITLIIGIDELMDMARTFTNVIGNAVACCVIARSENEVYNENVIVT